MVLIRTEVLIMPRIKKQELQKASMILRAYAHPLRLMILAFIDEQKTVNVNKIYKTLKLEQSITSQHLRILRTAGIVVTRRDGKMIHYSIDYKAVEKNIAIINKFVKN